jgi:hypothetical protein
MIRKSSVPCVALAFILSLAACGGGGGDPAPPAQQPAKPAAVNVGDTVAVTVSGKLISFNRAAPATLVGSIALTGLAGGESLVGIDVRPATNVLYGLGSQGNLYTVVPSTGAATLVTKLVADAADTTAPFTALSGTAFGVDFNPAADRLRVVSNTGLNLRINVDTGATFTDTTVTPATAAVSGSAYTNSFAGATNTRLFSINLATGTLDLQDPNPNAGIQVQGPALGVMPTSADFDIDGTNNIGFAALTVNGATALYRINLQAGAPAPTAILVDAIAGGEQIRGLALLQTGVTTVTGLTPTNGLFTFSPKTPNVISPIVPIGGLATGEVILGMDVRPQDGLLWALSSTGRLYTLNSTTGAASFKASISATLDGSPFVSVDFNPALNRLRVVTSQGQSLVLPVVDIPATATTAAIAAGTTVVQPAINRADGSASSVLAVAYNNNFAPVAGFTPATVLFDIDGASDVLTTQIAATGVLTNVGAAGQDLSGFTGFDAAGGDNGLVLGAVRVGNTGAFTLRSLNLTTGALAPYNFTATGTPTTDALSQIGGAAGPEVRDIAISLPK